MPFWLEHGADREYGGILSSMTEEGRLLNTTKYLWSQGRWLWMMSALHNRIEARPEFLDLARSTADFLLAHGRDSEGRWLYSVTREGQPLEGPISIFADCFAVYGLSEYARAVSEPRYLQAARETYAHILRRIAAPDFGDLAPYPVPAGHKAHGVPMILMDVSSELAITTGDDAIDAQADRFAAEVLTHFVRPERRLILEFLGPDYQELPPPEGTYVVPGHGIEGMWFLMHLARRRGDSATIARAAEIILWCLDLGWDHEQGGLILNLDTSRGTPLVGNSDKKVWWVHSEALYATLLAHRLTGAPEFGEWYRKIHEWSFARFPMREHGEWWQRLDRKGERVTDLIALPVKDPFHLARAVILSLELLQS